MVLFLFQANGLHITCVSHRFHFILSNDQLRQSGYVWLNNSDNFIKYDETMHLNSYVGGLYQQTSSGIARTNQQCYEKTGGCFATYAFEYKPGYDDSYIIWVNDGEKSWEMRQPGMGPDPLTEVGTRLIPREPMVRDLNIRWRGRADG